MPAPGRIPAIPSGSALEDGSHVPPDAAQVAARSDLDDAIGQREQAVEQREGEGTEARNYVEEFFFDGVLALEGRMKLSAIFKATIGASATF